jgi:hypothetical protein
MFLSRAGILKKDQILDLYLPDPNCDGSVGQIYNDDVKYVENLEDGEYLFAVIQSRQKPQLVFGFKKSSKKKSRSKKSSKKKSSSKKSSKKKSRSKKSN